MAVPHTLAHIVSALVVVNLTLVLTCALVVGDVSNGATRELDLCVVVVESPDPSSMSSRSFDDVVATIVSATELLGGKARVHSVRPGIRWKDCCSDRPGQRRPHRPASRRYVIFGANLLFALPEYASTPPIPPEWIIYNLEQVGKTQYFNSVIFSLMREHEVWEYSPQNAKLLAAAGVPTVRMPIGFAPRLVSTKTAAVDTSAKDIDVLLVGTCNKQRCDVIRAVARQGFVARLAGPACGGGMCSDLQLPPAYGLARDHLLHRARIVLNVHYFDAAIFEVVRVSYLLANGHFVISERGRDRGLEAEYEAGVVFVEGRVALPEVCADYLSRPSSALAEQRRHAIARAGYHLVREFHIERYLRCPVFRKATSSRNPRNVSEFLHATRWYTHESLSAIATFRLPQPSEQIGKVCDTSISLTESGHLVFANGDAKLALPGFGGGDRVPVSVTITSTMIRISANGDDSMHQHPTNLWCLRTNPHSTVGQFRVSLLDNALPPEAAAMLRAFANDTAFVAPQWFRIVVDMRDADVPVEEQLLLNSIRHYVQQGGLVVYRSKEPHPLFAKQLAGAAQRVILTNDFTTSLDIIVADEPLFQNATWTFQVQSHMLLQSPWGRTVSLRQAAFVLHALGFTRATSKQVATVSSPTPGQDTVQVTRIHEGTGVGRSRASVAALALLWPFVMRPVATPASLNFEPLPWWVYSAELPCLQPDKATRQSGYQLPWRSGLVVLLVVGAGLLRWKSRTCLGMRRSRLPRRDH